MAMERLHLKKVGPFLAALLLAVVLPGTAMAHAVPGGEWSFAGVEHIVKPAPGNPIPARFAFRSAANGAWTARAGAIARASLGAAVRARVFNPWGVALVAGITAAGYVLDEQAQQIIVPAQSGSGVEITPDRVPGWKSTGWSDYCSSFHLAEAQACNPGTYHLDLCRGQGRQCTQGPEYFLYQPSGNILHARDIFWWGGSGTPDCGSWVWTGSGCEPAQDRPLADTELADWALENLSPGQIEDLFYDPQTGAPLPVPEESAIHDALERDTAAQQDGDPTTVPQETVEVKSPEQVQEEQAREERLNLPGTPEFDTTLETPQKTDLPGELDKRAATITQWIRDHVGLRVSAGACSVSIPIQFYGAASSAEFSMCRFAGVFQDMGAIVLSLSYVLAGLLVLRL